MPFHYSNGVITVSSSRSEPATKSLKSFCLPVNSKSTQPHINDLGGCSCQVLKHLSFAKAQTLEAVDALHAGKIFHRDIKPDNLLNTSSGDLLLIDYDISCYQSALQTCLAGTDRYRSPRLNSSAPAWKSDDDLLSLGLSFAELLDIYQLPESSGAK